MSLRRTAVDLVRKALSAMIVSVLGCHYWQRVAPRPDKGTLARGNNGYEETDRGHCCVIRYSFRSSVSGSRRVAGNDVSRNARRGFFVPPRRSDAPQVLAYLRE